MQDPIKQFTLPQLINEWHLLKIIHESPNEPFPTDPEDPATIVAMLKGEYQRDKQAWEEHRKFWSDPVTYKARRHDIEWQMIERGAKRQDLESKNVVPGLGWSYFE